MGFWHNRWATQQTGWHKADFNELLVKYWPSLNTPNGCDVLVPLCGKSRDMLWLANQGHSVIGLEMVEQAITTFFSENKLNYIIEEKTTHKIYTSKPFTIYHGNVFDIESRALKVDAWYDRAAMIAIEPSNRGTYVEQIRSHTKPGAVGLLITFAYPQEEMEGPPYSLDDNQVTELFSNGFKVECLENIQLDDDKDRGLSFVTSSVFKLIRI